MGIGALVSSKVNQWTLLVGAIPIAYGLSLGMPRGLPLDARQTEELLLTSAQSLVAAIMLADMRFGRREAIVLAVLFAAQLFFPSTQARYWFMGFYLVLGAALLIWGPKSQRNAFMQLVIPRWGSWRAKEG